jgi:hypothetical protein
MPVVANIEKQLREKDLWDDNFDMDMTSTADEQKDIRGVYWGQGLKTLTSFH